MAKTFEDYFATYVEILDAQRQIIFEAEDATGYTNQVNQNYNNCNRHFMKHVCDLYKKITVERDEQGAEQVNRDIISHLRNRGVNAWEFLVGNCLRERRDYLENLPNMEVSKEAWDKCQEATRFFIMGRNERSYDSGKAIAFFQKGNQCLAQLKTLASTEARQNLRQNRRNKFVLFISAGLLVVAALTFIATYICGCPGEL